MVSTRACNSTFERNLLFIWFQILKVDIKMPERVEPYDDYQPSFDDHAQIWLLVHLRSLRYFIFVNKL